MKRTFALGAVLTAGVVAVPAGAASAAIIELGATKTAVTAPVCGSLKANACKIILTRATALETVRDGAAYPTTVKKAGRIVAFTVGLSALTSNRATRLGYIKGLDHKYGGTARVAITVLKPVGAKRLRQWKVVASSPVFHVQPYLGEVVQLPLTTTLPVARGDVVGLTTPTWAPVLSIDLTATKFAYRQSRTGTPSVCAAAVVPPNSAAQLTMGSSARYGCDYPGTRVEYSATEVTTPSYPKNYVHSRRRAGVRRR